ncbi:hypothetical protein BDN71DRAFT_1451776 [Pleurotus eryngii]|uniref:Uncharacterized protein n=1 Tax=Pleurotus eryngii TaxID=5323 RepID=A0A9P5ZUX4_PLEER|nr:hypothetical protein BDN71DRAFT_1451776 [Pleurotus eryngii]
MAWSDLSSETFANPRTGLEHCDPRVTSRVSVAASTTLISDAMASSVLLMGAWCYSV